MQEISVSAELVQLTRAAFAARGLGPLVCAQHDLRAALRRVLVSGQWSQLVETQRGLSDSPPLMARFNENLHAVLETPELGGHEADARWRGLVLAIPATITSRSGTLLALPSSAAHALRDTLRERFPPGTGMRLVGRPVPQLAAYRMGTQALYELIEELASGERSERAASSSPPDGAFVAHGRSLGQHYFFALAVTTRPEQLGLDLPGDLQAEPRLVKWAADQTEKITSDFAERGWPLLLRVFPPRRLRDMISSAPVLGDVRELDGLLEDTASRLGAPVNMLRADLTLARGGEAGVRIALSDRNANTPLAHAVYRLSALGAEAGAYRVAVRLASAGIELAASDENLQSAVQRAIMLTNVPVPTEPATPRDQAAPHPLGLKTFRSRFSRASRQSN